jgi:hypothetical protein
MYDAQAVGAALITVGIIMAMYACFFRGWSNDLRQTSLHNRPLDDNGWMTDIDNRQ